MAIRTELALRLPNSPGALAAVCRLLGDERVGILAAALEASGQLRLVVDNHLRALSVLRDRHYQVVERAVIVLAVSNRPGSLASILTSMADAGVNVDYAYGGGAAGAASAAVVVGVDDVQRAASRTGA
jgi:hypothetical protein